MDQGCPYGLCWPLCQILNCWLLRDFRNRAIPRDSIPNSNPPVGTVGDNVPAGFGDTHAMYPAGQLEQSGYHA